MKVALDFDTLETQGMLRTETFQQLRDRAGWYDPRVLAGFEEALKDRANYTAKALSIGELEPRMILEKDIVSSNGQLIISRGQEICSVIVQRLANYHSRTKIIEPVHVLVPM